MTRIRESIRRPYNKEAGKSEPLRKENFQSESDYYDEALNILNRDIGKAHAKLRVQKYLLMGATALLATMLYLLRELVLMLIKAKISG